MSWFKKLFRKWSKEAWEHREDAIPPLGSGRTHHSPVQMDAVISSTYRLAVIPAMNGRIIEVATFKRNPNGPDWFSSFYIIGDGEKISEALEKIILMKELETK
jgi:hypothetical protein